MEHVRDKFFRVECRFRERSDVLELYAGQPGVRYGPDQRRDARHSFLSAVARGLRAFAREGEGADPRPRCLGRRAPSPANDED